MVIYNREVCDIYFLDSVVSMVQAGGKGPAADYYGLDKSANPIDMDAAAEGANFQKLLQNAIIESAAPLPVRRGINNYVSWGRR